MLYGMRHQCVRSIRVYRHIYSLSMPVHELVSNSQSLVLLLL